MEKLKVRIEESESGGSKLENAAYYVLMGTAFLLPIFFIPSLTFPFQFSKSVFISLAVLLAFALWIIARLKDGKYLLPNNLVFLGSAIVLLVTAISSFFSPAMLTSFVGQGFEIGTWANLVVLFCVMFLFSALFRPKERVFYLYLALFLSFGLIIVFHALRFVFGPGFLAFGLFTDITSNLIGKWNDLGIFFGLVTMLAVMTLDLLSLSKLFRILVWSILVFALLSLTVVNFQTIWYVLAAFSLLFYVYTFAFKKDFLESNDVFAGNPEGQPAGRMSRFKKGSIIALIVLVVSLVFLADSYTTNRRIGTSIAQRFNVSNLEVRPNWSSTLNVAKSALKQDPILGSGPNRFVTQWLLKKPAGINESIFWNTDFNFGIGLLPTFIVTNGMIGFLAWLFLMLGIVYIGLRALLSPISDKLARYLSVSSFFAAIFLWTFFIFYIPSTVILTLTFLFTGVFLASLYNERLLTPKTISFIEEPKISFVSVLVLTVLLVGVVALSYIFGQKFFAAAYYQRALIASNAGNLPQAEEYVKKALGLSSHDLYERFIV